MESGIDQSDTRVSPPDQISRHIMLSSLRGMVTEVERMGETSGSGECYVLRYHKASGDTGVLLHVAEPSDSMPWTGFRCRDTHWRFVKRGRRLALGAQISR